MKSRGEDRRPLLVDDMPHLSLQKLTKVFGSTPAVKEVSLDIERGEFFSLLGPSGCGKSTLLRLLAGLEEPTEGHILLDGADITGRPPQKRGVGLVFQNYALFPHMTVAQNLGYGLRGKSKAEIATRVRKMLEILRLSRRGEAPVTNLSGGEQQRVALGRAMVVEPSVLLFDEPLSNLDITLRQETREEIRRLQRRTGITTVYVTHDQSEAMCLSDRMAVMRAGTIQQVGRPDELYDHPASSFVAEFLGRANLLPVAGSFPIPPEVSSNAGENDVVVVKPEAVRLVSPGESAELWAIVLEKEYLGFTTHLRVKAGGLELRVASMTANLPPGVSPGDRVGMSVDWSRVTILPEKPS